MSSPFNNISTGEHCCIGNMYFDSWFLVKQDVGIGFVAQTPGLPRPPQITNIGVYNAQVCPGFQCQIGWPCVIPWGGGEAPVHLCTQHLAQGGEAPPSPPQPTYCTSGRHKYTAMKGLLL